MQVRGDRICTFSILVFSIASLSVSLISVPAGIRISYSESGSITSSSKTRPKIRSPSGSMISPDSISAVISIPSRVPQSSSNTTLSWDTSTKRLVRYPEFAVFNAVSANPFLAPCVEIKYSSTLSPSRKFACMGVSIISPEGFAIKPRMPANCFICWLLPRAPESAIINIEFTL